MTELLTAAQMRAIEEAAIASGEVTGLELMERAGRGVVEAIFEEWPELAQTSHRAVVLCGPGNNGGDGFVVARLLKEWGWEVEVFLYGDPEKLPPDAKVNYERWGEKGEVAPLIPGSLDQSVDRGLENAIYKDQYDASGTWESETNIGQQTIFIDALFGTGLKRRFEEDLLDVLKEWGDYCYEYAVAVDMPSGLCSDSGKCIGGHWVFSKLLVTFETPKVGHFLGHNMYDIKSFKTVDLNFHWNTDADTVGLLGYTDLQLDKDGWFDNGMQKTLRTHKYSHGHALIFAGGPGKTGAARLAARGALRIGAGLVTLGVPPSAQMEVASQVTAIMLRRVTDGSGEVDGLDVTLRDDRINALCIGPGLGIGARGEALVKTTLEGKRATVLDADALTLLAQDKALFDCLHKNCVLTPHGGEFARLFPDIAEKLNAPATKGPAYSKVDATREAAKRAGCVVLFKGPDTVIAHPDGRCSINSAQYERAAPWLATAGSGDVLAGFITGLLARGFDPMRAAETAAWLHVECARSLGPGLIAEDLPEELPKVFRDLGL
ncbi:NAD(P)H-hydrate dehydratase [Roseovarius aestuarii]|uniref:Bifunctional NAD(P)H-hydrate repair enzyme n=1 Tax=Roseovarius aestuarii TaxID=475083 RepID=A0A1X7BXA1_9RHOB|nr:NAD(P)H-hydrate dehydratase [Roseovarius aestuarii]SMC14120.1 Bifunctional NAD(P)H-hydrate repair enzyme Nnr [Roseovarius aestuarii]